MYLYDKTLFVMISSNDGRSLVKTSRATRTLWSGQFSTIIYTFVLSQIIKPTNRLSRVGE